jgi:TRAP-type C4-dicarboxylate transport system permease small subunit
VVKLFIFLEAVNRFLVRMEKNLTILFLACMVMVAFAQVAIRNLFGVGYVWMDESVRVMTLWLVFLGAGLASQYASHIRMDILLLIISERTKYIVNVIANIFIMMVCMGFFVAAIKHVFYQFHSSVHLVLTGIPDWITSLVIPYFFAIAVFRSLLHIKSNIQREKREAFSIDVVEVEAATQES